MLLLEDVLVLAGVRVLVELLVLRQVRVLVVEGVVPVVVRCHHGGEADGPSAAGHQVLVRRRGTASVVAARGVHHHQVGAGVGQRSRGEAAHVVVAGGGVADSIEIVVGEGGGVVDEDLVDVLVVKGREVVIHMGGRGGGPVGECCVVARAHELRVLLLEGGLDVGDLGGVLVKGLVLEGPCGAEEGLGLLGAGSSPREELLLFYAGIHCGNQLALF